jgi:hypothetical protein
MRKMIVLLVALTATTVFAAGGLQVSPASVTLNVGDSAILTATDAPGGFSSGFAYNVTFHSDAPDVADISGFASGSGYFKPDPIPHNGEIYVLAIGPGIAHVHVGCCYELATVIVKPTPVLAVQPDDVTVARGKQVTLVASVTDALSPVAYQWFRGHTGDESKLLQLSSSPILTFAPDPGTNAVWLRAMSGTWQSTAEVKVTVMPVRRRAAR